MQRLTKIAISIALIWVALVMIVAIVQSTTYTGLIAALSEWQFDHLGQAFPAMTFLLLLAVFALPGLLLLGYAIRRVNVTRGLSADALVIQRSARMLRVLTVVAVLLAIAMAIVLIQMTQLPGDTGRPTRVEVGMTPDNGLVEQPTRLVGQYRYDRTATFRQSVLVAHRDYRFVPVQPTGARPTDLIGVLVEASTLPANRRAVAEEHVGVLRHGGLPPAIAHLYRDAGFRLAPNVYVLYPDRRAMTWPYLAVASQLAIVVLLLAIAALLTRRRLRLLREGRAPMVAVPAA